MAAPKIHDKYEQLICPYNKLHVVEAYRFQRHLLKCKQAYSSKDFAHCSFNYTHVVPAKELDYHQTTCPDRGRLDSDMVKGSARSEEAPQPVFVDQYAPVDILPSTECWDDDGPSVLYKLGGDGFKPVVEKKKRAQTGRSTADIEGWLAGQSDVSPEDEEWEPRKAKDSEPRLPKTMPKAMSAAPLPKPAEKKPPQAFSHSLAMAGAGRGQTVTVPSLPPSLLALGRGRGRGLGRGRGGGSPLTNSVAGGENSDSSSTASCPSPKTLRMSTPGGTPQGRGRSVTRREDRASPSVGAKDAGDREPDTGPVTRESVPLPRGLSRIAASLGQIRPTAGRGLMKGLQQQEAGPIVGETNKKDESEEDEQQRKLVRKLRKKISEVEILRKQQEMGKTLDESQLAKINQYEEFRRQLQKVGANCG